MKICVFSDSHGNTWKMKEAVQQEKPDFVFFLGDGEGDLASLQREFPQLPAEAVRGNCDIYSQLPTDLCCTVGGIRFFLTHGHRYGVKWDRDFLSLVTEAKKNLAQVVLFGHTHETYLEQRGDLLLMNPGSARGYGASYGVIEIRDGKMDPWIAEL